MKMTQRMPALPRCDSHHQDGAETNTAHTYKRRFAMANPWFRVYSEFATDAKVQSMPEAMQRRFMMLLCLRCSNALSTLQNDEIAFALRISEEDLAETKTLFLRKSFIDATWEIINWEKRQFLSDSSATRVAKHRAKVKEQKKQDSNVTVTPQNKTDTEQKQNKTEADKRITSQPAVAPRDWIPQASWAGYVEMRLKKKKEPTARAIELLVAELEKLKATGQDIAAVLDKSTLNGWTDIYAIKVGQQAGASPSQPHRHVGFDTKNYSEGVTADGRIA